MSLQRYRIELDTFGSSLKLTAADDGDYYLVDEVSNFLARQEVAMSQLRDDKRDHERFVDRLMRLMDAEMFDDARDEVAAEYRSIHGPSDSEVRKLFPNTRRKP